MQKITVYDIEAEQLEKIADDNDTNVAEIVEMLFEYVEDMKRAIISMEGRAVKMFDVARQMRNKRIIGEKE